MATDLQLNVSDWNRLLLSFSARIPSAALERATTAQSEGLALLQQRDYRAAQISLQHAASLLEQHLAHAPKRQLAEIQLALALVAARLGQHDRADQLLRALLTWRPHLDGGAQLPLPRDLRQRLRHIRQQLARSATFPLEVISSPAGARVYVDGSFVGETPTRIALHPGRHYVAVKRRGFLKQLVAAQVAERDDNRLRVTLTRLDQYLLVDRALEQARIAVGKPQLPTRVTDLRSVLFIDQAVFVRPQLRGNTTRLRADLYDLHSGRQLASASAILDGTPQGDRNAYAALAAALYAQAGVARTPKGHFRSTTKPFYRRWWFWAATAAVVGGAALTAGLWPRDRGCTGSADRPCLVIKN